VHGTQDPGIYEGQARADRATARCTIAHLDRTERPVVRHHPQHIPQETT
jgi:hypothetical protein